MARKALDNLNGGKAGSQGGLQEMAKAALSKMDGPGAVKSSGVGSGDIASLAKMAMGNLNGVSSKFMPDVGESNNIEDLTFRALHSMPADGKWVDDAMSGDSKKLSDLAKAALAKQFPPVEGGVLDKMSEEDKKEAEDIAMKEAEKI
jgi:hypothetical protein